MLKNHLILVNLMVNLHASVILIYVYMEPVQSYPSRLVRGCMQITKSC